MPTVEQQIATMNEKLSEIHKLLHAQNKPKWVKVGAITELTGWDCRKLEWARRNAVIDFKEGVDGTMYYDLNSLPKEFILKTS